MLPKVTLAFPSVVDSGTLLAEAVLAARFVPKIETSDPGATAWPVVKLAPLIMPPFEITGVCAKANAALAIIAEERTVSFNTPPNILDCKRSRGACGIETAEFTSEKARP